MERVVSADEAGHDLLALLDRVSHGDHVVITRRGRRRAVLLDYGQLRTLQDVARLARDPEAQAAIARSDEDVRAGRVYALKGRPTVQRILASTSRRRPTTARG